MLWTASSGVASCDLLNQRRHLCSRPVEAQETVEQNDESQWLVGMPAWLRTAGVERTSCIYKGVESVWWCDIRSLYSRSSSFKMIETSTSGLSWRMS